MILSRVAGAPSWRAATTSAWLGTLAIGAAAYFIVVRACAYDAMAVSRYVAYFLFHVVLPGVVTLAWVNQRPISVTTAMALGIPTGFALEIAAFLALAAIGGKALVPFLPCLWVAAGAWQWRARAKGPIRLRLGRFHAGVALALAALVLHTVVSAASHLYAESPLVGQLPQRPIFHDWVYLISRAASIKNLWPLEDPSLAGVALHYHYFMLVHAASASAVTGLEITTVLLRLMVIPLGVALTLQAFALGRKLSRRAWGGVLAALLTVAAGELSFTTNPNESMFLGRFERWLFVSPTFYFGVVFFGALLVGVAELRPARASSWRRFVWLTLLAAAATGAKGTVMPVILPALTAWAGWWAWRTRAFPWSPAILLVLMSAAFLSVYQATMAGWGTGAAGFAPLDVFRVSEFWRHNHALASQWLPAELMPWAAVAGAALVLAGTLGVRLLAVPLLCARQTAADAPLVAWLGAVFLTATVMGVLMKLDADSELYVLLMMRLPAAILAAAFIVRLIGQGPATTGQRASARVDPLRRLRPIRPALATLATAVVAVTLAWQIVGLLRRNQSGFADWRRAVVGLKMDGDMSALREAMLWVRANTEKNAVLIADAFTPHNLRHDHWGALDRTLAGVHYYYSALSERRMLVEGPHYLLDPRRVTERLALAGEIFHEGSAPSSPLLAEWPCYAVLDRTVAKPGTLALPPAAQVYRNARFEIYRLPRTGPTRAIGALAAQQP